MENGRGEEDFCQVARFKPALKEAEVILVEGTPGKMDCYYELGGQFRYTSDAWHITLIDQETVLADAWS